MNKDLLIQNIAKYAKANDESMSHACIASGAGKSFISDIRRGRMPSLSKFVDLAKYLGVSTSDLVGDNVSNLDISGAAETLVGLFEELNPEGQEKLLDYADDLALSGKYKKHRADSMDKEA